MASTFIELEQLSNEHFVGIAKNNKLEIQLKPVPVTLLPIDSYTTNRPAASIATFVDNNNERYKLQVQGNFGKLHLDFTCKVAALGATGTWRLPDNSPTPKALIEVQTYDKGTIWISRNSRVIRWAGLTVDNRYIIDLIGFWE